MSFERVASLADLSGSGCLGVRIAGIEVGIFSVEGDLYAMENLCPHAGSRLSDGDLQGCVIFCAAHGWDYDVRTGFRPGDADGFPIPCFAIQVRDGSIWVDLHDVINRPKRRRQIADRDAVRIERLAPDAWPRLRKIRLRALRDAPEAFGSRFDEAAVRPTESWPQSIEELATFLGVLDGADIGIVRAVKLEATPGTGNLLSMWVAPEVRRRGVGELLVEAVIDWARSEGLGRLVLDVADLNAHAIALYERMGFEPTGETGNLGPGRESVLEHQRALQL